MENEKEYILSIKGGGKNREIKLSQGLFKFAVGSIIAGLIIFVGACSFSIYSALNKQRDAEMVNEVQKAEEVQQEQLLEISKKASDLKEQLDNLEQQEKELRIQAGLKPPKTEKDAQPAKNPENAENNPNAPAATEDNSTDEPNGQGGPVGDLTIEEVKEALSMLEKSAEIRRASLDDFQKELKVVREQLFASALRGGASGTVSLPGIISPGILDISKFGGKPSADPNMPSIWPSTGVVTSPYGLRWGGSDFHPGMDIADEMGTPIVATADGVIDYAGWNAGGYGNMVDIDHGNGIMTRYGHASQVVVTAGQQVKRGQVIAYMGSTGFSTGPHVHYEVIINGQRVNPSGFL